MDDLERVESLIRVGYFTAPSGVIIKPFNIPIKTETVEVITGGKVIFANDGREQVYGKGAIFWHISRDETVHVTPPDDPYRCVVFHFRVKDRKRIVPRVTIWDDDAALDRFAGEAIRYFHNETYDRNKLCSYFYSQLLWQSYRYTCKKSHEEYPDQVRRAVSYINRNLGSGITVEDIAANCGVSKPYLFALFQKHLNGSPHKYLNECRLRKSRTLLAGSDSIKEIAAQCGFENIEVFYRLFKQSADMTPAEYRKKFSPYSLG